MEVSVLLMQQIAQLFIVLLMGYVVVKAGLLKASDSKVLSVVFVYLVMPCVVLNAFQIDDTPQIRTGLLYSMGIAVGMHVVFLVLNAIFKRPLKLDVVEQVNIIYGNAAALVIPLVQALLGEEYVVYSCAFVIVQLILLWTHASACLQEGAKLEWKKILTNVNLIAIVAGALLYLLHISLPSPIVNTLSSVGAMIGPTFVAIISTLRNPLQQRKKSLNCYILHINFSRFNFLNPSKIKSRCFCKSFLCHSNFLS